MAAGATARRWAATVLALVLAVGLGLVPAMAAPPLLRLAPPVTFVALGDMPYGSDMAVGPGYRHLIGLINAERPAFSVHIGDFKDGLAVCDDAEYELQATNFHLFEGAVVYTPGDNDWMDCRRRGADPLERLSALKKRFFPAPRSLGQRAMAVERQADLMPAHAQMVENLRWQQGAVLFATFHTVGPDNGFDPANPAMVREATAREAANAAWIGDAFEQARARRLGALVLFTQAEVQRGLLRRGQQRVLPEFAVSISQTLLPLAAAAPFPVLLVHGDFHQFHFDHAFLDAQRRPIPNLWRLEVFGAPRMHALKVKVAPGTPQPFAVTPIWNPLSPDPRR